MAESDQRTIASLLRDREPGMYAYDPVATAGTNLSTRAATMPWYPVSILAEALRGTGVMDEESVVGADRTPELWEIPGTQEWMQRQIGGDPMATENIIADLATPDPFDAGRLAMAGIMFKKGMPEYDAFIGLADAQRGKPEIAMTKAQRAMGGGVMNPVVEHVGDLTHRMSERTTMTDPYRGLEFVKPKVDRTLRLLDSGYGFGREFRENIASNAKYRGKPESEVWEETNKALKEYAEAHKELRVYNRPQELARNAAVAIGEGQIAEARSNLRQLQWLTEDPERWAEKASEFDPNYDDLYQSVRLIDKRRAAQGGFEDNVVIGAAPHKPTTRIGKAMYRDQPGLNSLVRWITHLNDNKIKTMKVGKEGDNWVFYVEQTSEGSGKIMKYIRTPENPRKMLLRSEEDIPNIRSEMEKFDGEIIPIQGKFEA